MLVLTRKSGESVVIDGSITVTVIRMRGNVVRLGIEAPKETLIRRSELPKRVSDREPSLAGSW